MQPLIEKLRNPRVWSLNVQLLILYCVSVAMFFAVDKANRTIAGALKDGVKNGKAPNQLAVFGLAAASNVLAVWALVFAGAQLRTVPRLLMVGLPLLLLVEQHVRSIRANQDNRRFELLLAAGMTAGIICGVAALMRGGPIK